MKNGIPGLSQPLLESLPSRVVSLAERIIIKVGSSVSASEVDTWEQIAADVAVLQRQGKRVTIVASGAVALGRDKPTSTGLHRVRRAWASVGQMKLTSRVERCFGNAGFRSAQVLVRHSDSVDNASAQRIAQLLDDLSADHIVPVVNEDDSHRLESACFSDNDQLSAWLGRVWHAQLIVFLTDIDGVYDEDPSLPVRGGRRIDFLDESRLTTTPAGGAGRSGKGTGGMRSKIDAARSALAYGCNSIIASGLLPLPLLSAQQTGRCTVILTDGLRTFPRI